ncbi:MAG: PilT/PilU family type 4a pilus ATPase [Coriobacteriales bacterium]|nr:PilT/PilU family type 4a pilus ATPase [Coriobacteriales bacterium]
MATLDTIVCTASNMGTSDILIAAGVPVRFRIDGSLVDANDQPLTPEETEALSREAIGDEVEQVMNGVEVDTAITFSNGVRCRLNIYRSMGHACMAIRLLANKIPDLDSLGVPPVVAHDFPNYQRGIVIVTGETGSGKSTTLAALVDKINHSRPDHIVTFEDPIEYVYQPDRCSIDQREIGRDTASFAEGLRAVLRQDPDVILIGEMRDLATIETALTAAETGHLVFGTLHTQSAPDSIDRLVDVFPEERQRQIRLQLSMTLKAVVSQQLIKRREGKGRVLAAEVMIVNPAIKNLIREGKTPQIANTLATSAELGSITMDRALQQLVRSRTISAADAIEAAHDPEQMRRTVR